MTSRLWRLIQQWLDAQFFAVTQAQLAEKLNVTRSAVSQWKHGQARPTPTNLRDLANLTRISYVDLRTAMVEDLGYVLEDEEVGDSEDGSAPNARAGVSPADDVTVRSEEGARVVLPPSESSDSVRRHGPRGQDRRE